MKQLFVLTILLNLFNFIHAQQACILRVGDSCRVSGQGAQVRTSPNYNYRILGTIGAQNTGITAEVVQSKVINGYVKVKLHTPQSDTSAIGRLDNETVWLKKKDLECEAVFNMNEYRDSSNAWDDDILMVETYKRQNLCLYSKNTHAQLLLDRARAEYREEDYQAALDDLNGAIALFSYADNLIIYYWFRAHAKTELGYYQDAVGDFDYIIDRKDSLAEASYEFDINEVLCWKAQNLYLLGEDYTAKSLLNIVIASDAGNGFAYYLRGLVRYAQEDRPGACSDLQKAAESGFEKAFAELQAKCK